MKRLASLFTISILTLSVTACGTSNNINTLPSPENTGILANIEKPAKNAVALKDAKFDNSDFYELAEKNKKDYSKVQTDEAFGKNTEKNARWDYLPYRDFSELLRDIRYDNNTDYRYMTERDARYHFNKNTGAYEYAQSIYKATSTEMKRFIKLDTLVNALEINGRKISYSEIHNTPYRPGYKILPTTAAVRMPTFGEIYDYNRYENGIPYIKWDEYKAAKYYYNNYVRYMDMVMEYGPAKHKVYDLVHREISEYAGY